MSKNKDIEGIDYPIKCECGKLYYVDPCIEENTIRKRDRFGHIILVSKCPECGKEEDERDM